MSSLIVFGDASKYLPWLEEDKRRRLIQICDKKIDHPRVKTYGLETPIQIPLLAREIAWRTVFQEIKIVSLEKSSLFDSFEKELKKCRIGADLLLSEAADCGKAALQNAKQNKGVAFRSWKGLEKAFSNVPAFVIGAGPSLKKHTSLLAQFQDRGLILAGGSAIKALPMEPHFAAAIDPKREPAASSAPLCARSRTCPEALLGGSEKILFPDPTIPLLNRFYGIEEGFEGGWTVGNFLMSLAVFMGCNPIVFVGMDFCYIDNQKYGHCKETGSEDLVEMIDAKGCARQTQRDWVGAIQWTESLAKEREDLLFINTSEEGFCFQKPIQEMTLGETIKKYAPKDLHLKSEVKRVVSALPLLSFSEENIDLKAEVFEPLWRIWKPVFEREAEVDFNGISFEEKMEIHKHLFWSRVQQEIGIH